MNKTIYLISLLTIISFLQKPCHSLAISKCPPQWTHYPPTGHCYKLFSEKVSWNTASANCFRKNSYNVVVDSERENGFIAEMARAEVGENENVWLGAAKFGSRRQWSDASYVDYTSWAPGYPLSDRVKKCTMMRLNDSKWLNTCCVKSAVYVCMKKNGQKQN